MKPAHQGFTVGVVGAASLLGKELLAVLKERQFPVARLVEAEDTEGEPDMPVVDLREGFEPSIAEEALDEEEFDFVFVAAAPRALGAKSGGRTDEAPFLRSAAKLARATQGTVIDVSQGLASEPGGVVRIPFLERAAARPPKPGSAAPAGETGYLVSADPATILVSSLLLRLAARFSLVSAVAQVFLPASDIGPQAVEELQRQTSALLSFQKLPDGVFGQQLAFNLLPRFGRGRAKGVALAAIEKRIREQLCSYLAGRAPMPALRVFQAPVFHSVGVSLYVETAKAASVKALSEALKGERIELRQAGELAPSQVEASGSSGILVDAPIPDASRANGVWIWAVADNLRLAAVNAIEIAESLSGATRASGR
jgi:aspartate-semialdehyde dehydrogenase